MTKAKVINGELVFSSLLTKIRFMGNAEGKDVSLVIDDKPTPRMRKFFEGCLVPAFYYFHPNSGWRDFKDAREALKLEFSPNIRSVKLVLDGSTVRVAPSTTEMSKERFNMLVEGVMDWMMDNGLPYDVLDAEAYLTWRDTNDLDLIYPPLRRLKENYDKRKSRKAKTKAAKRA